MSARGAEGGSEPEADTVIGVAKPLKRGVDADLADADTIIVSRAEAVPARRAPKPKPDQGPNPKPLHAPPVQGTVLPGPPPPAPPASSRFAIRIGTHEPIPLDVPAYIGRRPSTPRITGLRLPRLVMVPSPSREVSSTHVELHEEGTTVVVTDLGSTNGTTVSNPGFPPQGLRGGESVVVGPGSVVDIGDGIRIIIVRGQDDSTAEGSS